jgi:pantoate--beta-alanine ligase
VRAADGLALSSRNARLSEQERAIAPFLFRSLRAVEEHAFKGAVPACREAGLRVLATQPALRLDYLEIAHPDTLRPLADWGDLTEASVLIAAYLGPVRLIDNLTLHR